MSFEEFRLKVIRELDSNFYGEGIPRGAQVVSTTRHPYRGGAYSVWIARPGTYCLCGHEVGSHWIDGCEDHDFVANKPEYCQCPLSWVQAGLHSLGLPEDYIFADKAISKGEA